MADSNSPVWISEADMKRVFKAVRNVERQFNGTNFIDTDYPPGPDNGPVTIIIETRDTDDYPPTGGGFYQAKVVSIEQVVNTGISPPWADVLDDDVLAFDVNGGVLESGTRYIAHVYGVFEGVTVASVEAVGAPVFTLNVVTNVCKVLNTYGAWTGIKVERTPVTFPAGTVFGEPVCETNPTGCCSPLPPPPPPPPPLPLGCPGCPGVTVPALTMNFTSKTGSATNLPDSLTLNYVGMAAVGPFDGWVMGGSYFISIGGANDQSWIWEYDDGTNPPSLTGVLNSIKVVCEDAGFRLVARFTSLSTGTFTPLGGPNNEPSTPFLISKELPCDTFDESGTVVLDTITYTASTGAGYEDSSVTVSISW